MRINSKDAEYEHILNCAKAMVSAARTAPKARGLDHLETLILTGEDKENFLNSAENNAKSLEGSQPYDSLIRDIENCRNADAIVFIAGRGEISGVNSAACGYCSYGSCKECMDADGFCSFMVTDVGIACGSAMSVAADMCVDNRIMYTVGKQARDLDIFDKPVKIAYAIPLSVTSKSIFFDRK